MSLRVRVLSSFFALLLTASAPAWADDLDDVLARGELRHLGIRYANFVTGDGDGFDVELVQGFAAYLGVRYTLVFSEFSGVMRDLLGKDVVRRGEDIELRNKYPIRGDLIAAGFTILPWRSTVVLFSAPTFPSQVWLVARADSPQAPIKATGSLARDILETKAKIRGKTLLVMEQTCLDPSNYGLAGRGIDFRPYTRSTNLNEMIPALLNGEAEFTLLDVPDAVLDLQKWAGMIKVIGPVSEKQFLGVAFRKSGSRLRDSFNIYLERIKGNGEYDSMIIKYYPGIGTYLPSIFSN